MQHIYMYNQNSEMGNAIAERLGLLKIRHRNSNFRYVPGRTVLNWGASNMPNSVRMCTVVNSPDAIGRSVHKLRCLQTLQAHGVLIPEFTVDLADAQHYVRDDGAYQRLRLTGHDGEGCSFIEGVGDLDPSAWMWTKALPIEHEFRVTMVKDYMCGCQWKVPTRDDPDTHIRTTDGGWGFRPVRRQDNINELYTLGVRTLRALGLDFGGIDVVKSGGQFYVLEVNTAPTMTPYVLDNFCNELRRTYID